WDEELKQWQHITEEGYETFAFFVLIGRADKGSQPQVETINTLATLYNWTDGSLTTLGNIDPSNVLIQVECQTSTNSKTGELRISAAFPKIPQAVVTKGRQSDPEELKALTATHSSAIRAIIKPYQGPVFNPA